MLLHSWFPLIWYATWASSNNVSFWHFEPNPEVRRGGGLQAKYLLQIFATMILHSWFPLIWYVIWHCSEKDEFWPIDPIFRVVQEGRSADKWFDTMLLHSWFPFIWYALKRVLITLNFDLLNPTQGSGVGRSAGKIFATSICYPVAAFLILFNLICNMTTCWKCWIPTN